MSSFFFFFFSIQIFYTKYQHKKQILLNLGAILEAGGSSIQDAIKVNIFLADMADFPAVNEVYNTFFTDPKPVSDVHLFFSFLFLNFSFFLFFFLSLKKNPIS